MSKRAILLLAGALALPLAWPAFGSESLPNVRTATPAKDFAAYLVLPTEVPWLKLDMRTKMPKGDFPLGRDTDSIGRLALPFVPHPLISARQETATAIERRM
jgi:hypothetical protein